MNNERTLQEAARRYARLQADDCTPSQQDEVDRWLAEDAGHRDAYSLAQQVTAGIARMAADERLNQKLRALADEAFAAYPTPVPGARSRQWKVAASLAASVAVATIAWIAHPLLHSPAADPVAYAAGELQRRSVTLDDGSQVELDVGTRIEVRMSRDSRRIELLSGRALFDVAHDSNRPFSVTASGARTTALGTKFQVQRDAGRVVVTLAEGSVSIDRERSEAGAASWQERLVPGEQLTLDAASAARSRQFVDTQLITSWTHGRHAFRGTPLREALDEVNRYAIRKVRLGDPSLADLPVAGNFIAGDSQVVVEAFAAVLPLRIVDGGSEIIVFRRYRD
ncbi:MAG TPA: FecR domain-containing protein [Povalibacter sp.]|uniref:FecR family protein n=1 Tax=Povalibacter sp. TaxID=1962978 RepID=UPI002C1BFE77|nr:FecR domain-containing protein [Povalibacter sp.]HMN43708.1 FecR domain-containing protein [Povalibacter sp.]